MNLGKLFDLLESNFHCSILIIIITLSRHVLSMTKILMEIKEAKYITQTTQAVNANNDN